MKDARHTTIELVISIALGVSVLGITDARAAGLPSGFILPAYSKTVSMDFKDADIKDVVKALSQQIGVNYLLAEGVPRRSVTVYLDNVPVEEALDMIISAQNLSYEFNEATNTLFIKAAPQDADLMETRIYQLKYASVPSSKINSTLSISAGASLGGGSSGGSSSSSSSSSGASAGSGASSGITNILQSVLSASGKISEDVRTNSLVITDLPKQFPLIERTLARLDVPVPQILIEVEMLDVAKDALDKMGLKFTADNVLTIDGSKTLDFGRGNNERGLERYNAITSFFTRGEVTTGLQAVLEFIRTDTSTRSLARPRILTLDNETAQIKISTDEVIGVTTNTTGSTGNNITQTAERMPTGVIFTVTPQANLLLGEITLALFPQVIDSGSKSSLGNYQNPETRSINALIKVKDGQTVVIGGLLREQKKSAVTRLPILGDIPLAGALFRHKNQETITRDLLIVLTPHILGMNDVPTASFTDVNGNSGFHREQGGSDPRSTAVTNALDRMSSPARE